MSSPKVVKEFSSFSDLANWARFEASKRPKPPPKPARTGPTKKPAGVRRAQGR